MTVGHHEGMRSIAPSVEARPVFHPGPTLAALVTVAGIWAVARHRDPL
jgi:hypothetical protein